jgi:topoisomerase (DNA) II binding protein 1
VRRNFFLQQTHHVCLAGVASANEEKTAPAVSKRKLLSVSGQSNVTCGNIGRTETHLESSSVPDVADAIEVLSSKVMLLQSIHFIVTGTSLWDIN